MYVRMYVSVYTVYVCMYVCMYVCECVHSVRIYVCRAVATSPVGTVSTGPLFRAVPKKIFLKIFSLVTKGETISNSTQITWVSLLESGGPTLKLLPL